MCGRILITRNVSALSLLLILGGLFACTQSTKIETAAAAAINPVRAEKPAVTNENGIFVDPVTGTNTASSGTMEQPLASLQWATDRALAQGKAVFAAGGAGRTYGPTWAKSEIYCGYNPADWSFDPSNYQSTIYGGTSKKFGVSVAAGANARLENCIIVGGDSTFTKTMGINNRGNTDLVANEIYGGGGTVASYGVITRAGVIDAVNNFIYGGTGGNATGWVAAAGESALVNNTIVSDSATNHSIGVNVWPNSQTVPLVNNIIDVSGSTATEAWALAVNSPAGVFMSNNNIYANTSGGDHLVNSYDGGHNYIDDTASINLCAWTGCAGSQNTYSFDSLFTGPGTINANSPCYDTGIDPGTLGYSNPASTTDYESESRPAGSGWDIGRDEAPAAPEKVYRVYYNTNISRSDPDGANPETLVTPSETGGLSASETNGKIYYTSTFSIRRMNPDGSGDENVINSTAKMWAIDIDNTNDKIYYNHYNLNDIYRAELDGPDETLIYDGADSPIFGLAVDELNGKILFVNDSSIKRMNLDGSSLETLISGLNSPMGLDVDSTIGKMYFTEYGGNKINSANLDGSNVQLEVSVDLPGAVKIDGARGKIYYTSIFGLKLYRANLDGSGAEIISASNLIYAIEIH